MLGLEINECIHTYLHKHFVLCLLSYFEDLSCFPLDPDRVPFLMLFHLCSCVSLAPMSSLHLVLVVSLSSRVRSVFLKSLFFVKILFLFMLLFCFTPWQLIFGGINLDFFGAKNPLLDSTSLTLHPARLHNLSRFGATLVSHLPVSTGCTPALSQGGCRRCHSIGLSQSRSSGVLPQRLQTNMADKATSASAHPQ